MKKNNRRLLGHPFVWIFLGSVAMGMSFFHPSALAQQQGTQVMNLPEDDDESLPPSLNSASSNSASSNSSSTNSAPALPHGRVRVQRRQPAWDEKTFYLFGGIDLGLATYSSSSATYSVNGKNEVDISRNGFDGGARLLLAYYRQNWLVDGGIAWQYLNGTETFADGNQLRVTTKNAYADLSPRYRINRSWQIGPEGEYWLGTDNGINSNPNATTSNNILLGGAQGIYEWMESSSKMRLGARWLMAFNSGTRTVMVAQVFFQFGFALFESSKNEEEPVRVNEQVNASDLDRASSYTTSNDPLPLATPEPIPSATPWPIANVLPTPKPIHSEKLVVTLDVTKLPFEFNSARLPKYNADRVREVGRFLGEHKSTWKSLVVQGHTDERGSNKYNDGLSKARADTVRQLLGEGGAPIARIKAVGYGKRHPIDKHHHEAAWAKNRRVELEFHGVKDVNMMKNGMN